MGFNYFYDYSVERTHVDNFIDTVESKGYIYVQGVCKEITEVYQEITEVYKEITKVTRKIYKVVYTEIY